MATATMLDAGSAEVERALTLPAPPRAFRAAVRVFLRFPGVDVVWLAVRESREQAAVIRSSQGARSAAGLGLQIEPAVGVGGALLLAGDPWRGELARSEATCLSPEERAFLNEEGTKHVMVIPLRGTSLR